MGTHVNLVAVSGPEVEEAFTQFILEKGRKLDNTGLWMKCDILWETEPEQVMKKMPAGSWVAYMYCFINVTPSINVEYSESRGIGEEPLRKVVRYQAGSWKKERPVLDAIMDVDAKGQVVQGTLKKFPSMNR